MKKQKTQNLKNNNGIFKSNVGADASVRPTSKARQNKGITLIALVITIIVMLILVAVTINIAVNGGLFDYAGKAVSETQISQEKEYITFAVSTIKMKKYADNDNTLISAKELEEELKKYEEGVTVEGFNVLTITFTSGRSYTINQDGDVVLGDIEQTAGKWKQFAAGSEEIYALKTNGDIYKYVPTNSENDTEEDAMFRELIANNGNIVSIRAWGSGYAYIMKNGKAYGLAGDEPICINDFYEELKNEKIVDVGYNSQIITEDGRAYFLQDGTYICANDEIDALNDKKILNAGEYKLSDSETVTMVILEDQKAYYVNAEGELICFSDLQEELSNKKIISSSFYNGILCWLVTEDGKAYQFLDGEFCCLNDTIDGLQEQQIVKVWVDKFDGSRCCHLLLDNGELVLMPLGGSEILNSTEILNSVELFPLLQDKKIMSTFGLGGLIWLEDGESYYSIENDSIVNFGDMQAFLQGKNIVQIAANDDGFFAVDSEGKVWSWGNNEGAKLGDGSGIDRTYPMCISEIEGNLLNGIKIIQVSAGGGHTVALDNNGKVWTWGADGDALGDGPTIQSRLAVIGVTPICISNIEDNPLNGTEIVQVSAGDWHTVALDVNGKVWSWGGNDYGELGYEPGETGTNIPTCISEIEGNPLNGKNIVQISTEEIHTVAIDDNGKVWSWGDNYFGQLGAGTETQTESSTPICISEIEVNPLNGTEIVQISAGQTHTVALDGNGRVWTWGLFVEELGVFKGDIPICISDIRSELKGKPIIIIEAGFGTTILLEDDYINYNIIIGFPPR